MTVEILNNGVQIGGTPTTGRTYPITLTARARDGEQATTSFNLRIRPAGYPIVVRPLPDRFIVIDKRTFMQDSINLNLNEIFRDSSPTNSPLSYSVSGLLDWLQYNPTTALISGTTTRTTAAGEYTITLTATANDGIPTDTTFQLQLTVRFYIRTKVFLEGALQ